MTNHLVNELRGIIADLDTLGTASATDRLVQLIAHVERLHAEPEPTAFSLDPEQEIRARALDAVARLFTGAPPTMFGATELAEDFADWIRDGGRP
jgi:hypothetical protein